MTDYYIKNWANFQHYKDRNPPWIKFHYDILTSNDWILLSDEGRLTMVVCMLIGSRNAGIVQNSPELVKKSGRLEFTPNLEDLVKCGFLIPLIDKTSDASICTLTQHPSVSSYLNPTLTQNKKEVVKQAKEVLEHLNIITGRGFRKWENIAACITREGCSVEDCNRVIDYKAQQWKGKDQLVHLNARTPWRIKHFSDYLDEALAKTTQAAYVKPPKTDDWGNVIPQWKLDMDAELERKEASNG